MVDRLIPVAGLSGLTMNYAQEGERDRLCSGSMPSQIGCLEAQEENSKDSWSSWKESGEAVFGCCTSTGVSLGS